MNIKSASYYISSGLSNLSVMIAQTINGREWTVTIHCIGANAESIWNQWGTNNDQAIIALLMALP